MPSIANANKVPSINAIFGGVADPVPDSLFNYKFDFTDSGMSYFPSTPTGKNDMDYFRSAPACLDTIGGFFNGTSRYNTGDAYTKIVGTESAFTSSFWIDTSSQIGGLQRIMVVGSSSAGGDGFYLAMQNTGSIRFRSNGFNANAPTAVNDGKPHFILVTYDGTTLKIYVDNVEDLSVVTTVSTFNPSALTIGATAGGVTGFFSGVLDDIRYYDRVLDTNERTALYNYRCDFNPSQITTSLWLDAQDQTAITDLLGAVSQWDDKSGNNYNATQSNVGRQPLTGSSSLNGLNSLSLDGIDDFLEISHVFENNQVSFYCVFRTSSPATNPLVGVLFSTAESGGTSDGMALTLYNGIIEDGVHRLRSEGTSLGAGSLFYLNGEEVGSGTKLYSSNSVSMFYFNAPTNGESSQAKTTIGTFTNSIFNAEADIGEIILVEGVGRSRKVEGYLAWKWGLVADLPSGHPHKESPPKT